MTQAEFDALFLDRWEVIATALEAGGKGVK